MIAANIIKAQQPKISFTSIQFLCDDYYALRRVYSRLQPFTVLFSFSAILVCFIDAQIHSFFLENMSGFERQ